MKRTLHYTSTSIVFVDALILSALIFTEINFKITLGMAKYLLILLKRNLPLVFFFNFNIKNVHNFLYFINSYFHFLFLFSILTHCTDGYILNLLQGVRNTALKIKKLRQLFENLYRILKIYLSKTE